MATSAGSVIVMVVVMVMAMVAVAIPSLLLISIRRIRTVGDSRRSFLQKSKASRKKPRSISRSQAQKHPLQHYVHCEDDHISSKPNTANKKRWKQQQEEDDGTNVSISLSICWPAGCCCCC
jgi:biopolymer transport protein ExbB/TolQ